MKKEKKAAKTITIGAKIEVELLERIEEKCNAFRYKPSMTQIVKEALEMWLESES